MEYDVRIEQVEPRPLMVVRRRVEKRELSKVVPECCGLVWNVVRAQKIAGAGRHVAVYLDCEMNVEVGVELETPIAETYGEVVGSATPGGRVATVAHFGPYQGLGKANEAIRAFCAACGLELAGPSWEVYGHWVEEWNKDPSKIRTDVFYLVKGDGV
jgi:effector-binding domain-containing protein